MNDHQIEAIILHAERQAGSNSFIGARLMGTVSVLLSSIGFFSLGIEVGSFLLAVCGFVTARLWSEGKKVKRELIKSRARTVWQKIDHVSAFGGSPSFKERHLLKDIERIYERDPQGKILPLSQAIRLVLAWKQQQKRLQAIAAHIEQMRLARTTLQEKQKLLRELNDENASLERALARLDDDIAPLERSHDALRASCTRLEALIVEVDATVRRRELHREVGELTTRLTSGHPHEADSFELSDEHLDIERQIGREIETYLQLERETDAHLRDL
ncbi:hypothetical protein IAD21_04633 [Abditibacteriota bacterium]|nr:hypothetical protein IAD21_04633 [Abditibacteriota bacterium]